MAASKNSRLAERREPRMDRTVLRIFNSFAEADQADREYSWSRTRAQRMRQAERLRQFNFRYGQGRPLPRFQRVLEIVELHGG
jgi:hypothetical protein